MAYIESWENRFRTMYMILAWEAGNFDKFLIPCQLPLQSANYPSFSFFNHFVRFYHTPCNCGLVSCWKGTFVWAHRLAGHVWGKWEVGTLLAPPEYSRNLVINKCMLTSYTWFNWNWLKCKSYLSDKINLVSCDTFPGIHLSGLTARARHTQGSDITY